MIEASNERETIEAGPSRPSRAEGPRRLVAGLLTTLALALIGALSLWIRWPGFTQGGFASHDVAGILYNAMVLERGGLPYVDTLEFKAPGSFYLAKLLAGPEGRDIARFQIWANLCGLASLGLVAALAWRLWGRLASVVAAGLLALHDAVLDSMDANYVTWANLPQVGAMWLGFEALRSRRASLRPTLWLLAGAAAGLATLCKQPNGVVLPVLLAMAMWPAVGPAVGQGRGAFARAKAWSRGVAWRPAVMVLAGFVLAHVPIALQYALRGELGALVEGYAFSSWALRYVGGREVGLGEGLSEGPMAFAHFLALPLVLAGFALGRGPGRGAQTGSPPVELRATTWLVVWLVATSFAASLGFRFYKGYFVAVAPPLVLLAAAPWGLLGRAAPLRGWIRAIVLIVLLPPLLARQAWTIAEQRHDRARPHDLGGRVIADHVAAQTGPDDTIWVWGWHLWDVYPLANRMSASRIYKTLGVLTPPNDDTWRLPASKQVFVDGPFADELLADLERSRPAYVVLGSTVPREQFVALQRLLRSSYRIDRRVRVGRVQFWRRADLELR